MNFIHKRTRGSDKMLFLQQITKHSNINLLTLIDMDKNVIGVNAGIVWKLLNDNKRWSYEDLKRAAGLSDRDLNAAIGWLARENKIDFEKDCGTDCLFLSVNVFIG